MLLDSRKQGGSFLCPLEDEDDSNKLWVIIRYMTIDGHTNEYRLSREYPGETIKIGRVKFRVREICMKGEGDNYDENNTDINSQEND